MRSKSEQETVTRYNQEERVLRLWTSWPADARRWPAPATPFQQTLHGGRARTPPGTGST